MQSCNRPIVPRHVVTATCGQPPACRAGSSAQRLSLVGGGICCAQTEVGGAMQRLQSQPPHARAAARPAGRRLSRAVLPRSVGGRAPATEACYRIREIKKQPSEPPPHRQPARAAVCTAKAQHPPPSLGRGRGNPPPPSSRRPRRACTWPAPSFVRQQIMLGRSPHPRGGSCALGGEQQAPGSAGGLSDRVKVGASSCHAEPGCC
jgi:hypothetical protein